MGVTGEVVSHTLLGIIMCECDCFLWPWSSLYFHKEEIKQTAVVAVSLHSKYEITEIMQDAIHPGGRVFDFANWRKKEPSVWERAGSAVVEP